MMHRPTVCPIMHWAVTLLAYLGDQELSLAYLQFCSDRQIFEVDALYYDVLAEAAIGYER